MIKALIFDCFGVLTADKWREFVGNLPPDVDAGRASELNRQYGAGFLTETDFLDQVSELTGQPTAVIKDLLDNEDDKNTALLNYIRELSKDYKIGLLSNVASDWICQELLTEAEQALFADMVLSFEVKLAKPDPRIFELACRRLGVEPAEAVMIDDIASYCEAAGQLGMKYIVYHDLKQMTTELQAMLAKNR